MPRRAQIVSAAPRMLHSRRCCPRAPRLAGAAALRVSQRRPAHSRMPAPAGLPAHIQQALTQWQGWDGSPGTAADIRRLTDAGDMQQLDLHYAQRMTFGRRQQP